MAKFDIDYSGRPSKSLVRARILNIIEESFHPKHEASEKVAYVSFSGFRFLDSLRFYNRFGIRSVYSIEHDRRRFKRAQFNRPYNFISITHGRVSEFVDKKLKDIVDFEKAIYLDYETIFGDMLVDDLEVLFSSSFFDKKGLLFITFNAYFKPRILTEKTVEIVPKGIRSKEAFQEWLLNGFSDYILHKVQKKYRRHKQITEMIKAIYEDTSRMTIFGYLIEDSDEERISLNKTSPEIFKFPDLTFLEKNYICNRIDRDPSKIADEIGIEEEQVMTFLKYI